MQEQNIPGINIQNNYGTVNNYAGKRDASQTTKITEETKKWLEDISHTISIERNDPKFGASTLTAEAIDFYKEFYNHINKLRKYKKAIFAFIDNLT